MTTKKLTIEEIEALEARLLARAKRRPSAELLARYGQDAGKGVSTKASDNLMPRIGPPTPICSIGSNAHDPRSRRRRRAVDREACRDGSGAREAAPRRLARPLHFPTKARPEANCDL